MELTLRSMAASRDVSFDAVLDAFKGVAAVSALR
jgi:hypothetical protein